MLSRNSAYIKVLHVYRTYFPDTQGGLEETVRQICLNTKAHNFHHRIFTLSLNPDPRIIHFDEADVYRYPLTMEIASCGMSLTGIFGFRKLIKWADIVHYHYPWPYGDFLHLLSMVHKPSIVSYQSDIVRQKTLLKLYKPLQKRFLQSVDRIVATSPNYLKSSTILCRYRDKISVIPNGLDASSYMVPDTGELAAACKEYGKDFFLFVGVLRYYKGLHYLLEAARDQIFNVIIAGKGPMENELQHRAAALGLQNVRFVGYVDDAVKKCLFTLARAIVFPSHERSEAFGMTLLEGAIYAKPLITAEIGTGTTFINRHNRTGLVVPPRDAAALQQAMQRLAEEKKFAETCGIQARKRYKKYFTGSVMGKQYITLYRQLLAG